MAFRWLWVALALGMVLAGCRVAPGSDGAVASRAYGPALYNERCALCHGPQGEGMGKVGSAIGNPEFLATAGDDFLADAIAKGRPGTTMAPWAENGLSHYQILSLARYIRSWQTAPSVGLDPTKKAAGDAARGSAHYTQQCAACHGPNGIPGRDPNLVGTSIANPVFLAQASDEFLVYAIANGRTGTVMPGFSQAKGGVLSDQDIADVVTYMRSWRN